MRRWCKRWAGALALAALGLAGHAQAGALRYCDPPGALTAADQDRLLRVAAAVRQVLDDSGARVAIVARSGLNLGLFGVRYSHAGLSLLDNDHAPWSVRQLYYACDEHRPLIFDQGLSGFVLGTNDPGIGYVSLLLPPPEAAEPLRRAALDKALALRLLGATYSANAYAFADRYQNCNQWLAEVLAAAWGPQVASRADALRWLQQQQLVPHRFALGLRPVLWLGASMPWLHNDDHPPELLDQAVYEVVMPSSLDELVQRLAPGTRRVEICHNRHQLVVHQGWRPLAEGCVPDAEDQVLALD